MKILFLDDERYRHQWADEHYAGHEVHHAHSLRQFKAALERVQRFDLISFDYDLEDLADPNRLTGLDAARWLVDHPASWPPECVVHSWNAVGKLKIRDALVAAGLKVTVCEAGNDETHGVATRIIDRRAR